MSWICNKCGQKHGHIVGKICTCHPNICEWCGEEKDVTDSRHYGYPQIPSKQSVKFKIGDQVRIDLRPDNRVCTYPTLHGKIGTIIYVDDDKFDNYWRGYKVAAEGDIVWVSKREIK